MKVLGSDGSHWNGYVNFEKTYDAGSRFHVTKASDSRRGGDMFEDKKFDAYCQQMFSLGELLTGCFHWLQPDIDPIVAADFYLERYFRYPFHFMPILDFEEKYAYEAGLQGHYSWCAQTWLEYVHRQTGRKPLVYTAKWYTSHFAQKYLSWLKEYDLWVAWYPFVYADWMKPPLPYPWTEYKIWQYSADGNRRGAEFGASSGDIDLNWFPGSYDDLLSWLNVDAPEPQQPTEPSGLYNIVLTGNLSVREKPEGGHAIDGDIIRYVLKGDVLTGYEVDSDGWYKIKENKNEWISGNTKWTTITEIMNPIPVEPPVEPPVDETFEEETKRRLNRLEEVVFEDEI